MDQLISLCMIVKNEEKVLRRCLESVKGLADEIIVIDTGSDDGTKAIARSFTDEVHDFVWIDDFSAAKNEAIRRANGKWIFVLDADEYVDKEKSAELRRFLSTQDHTKPIGFTLPVYNFTHNVELGRFVESTAVRLFANHPLVRFERPIHEQVMSGSEPMAGTNYPFIIFHTGYTQQTWSEKKKGDRNLQLFEKLKAQKQFEEYDYFTLGNEYNAQGDPKKALQHYKKALTKRAQTQSFYPFCYHQAVACLIQLDWLKEALEYIEQGLKNWPQFVDYYCFKAMVCQQLGLYDEAIQLFEKCIDIASHPSQKDGRYWLMSANYGNLIPYSNLHALYARRLDIQQTVYYLTKLIQFHKSDYLVLYHLLGLLTQREPVSEVIAFLDKIYNEKTPEQSLQLLQVSFLLGNKELSVHYHAECHKLNIPLPAQHRLYYALITDQPSEFDLILASLEDPEIPAMDHKLSFLASIVWQDAKYGTYIQASSDNSLIDMHAYLFAPEQATTDNIPFDEDFVTKLLVDLFKMNRFEGYDWLIQRYSAFNDALANRMGDHFFSQFQVELALDYYSLLLDQNQLGDNGYRNVGFLYIYQGNQEEGAAFLAQSIEMTPEDATSYPTFFKACQDQELRKKVRDLYRQKHTQYASIPLIQTIIKDQA
ncbi:glycosyltransferase [Cohnella sp. GbtcB17]|uniref:glycosyltransferase n=1 Tax=Cohnella sp. GbtcB17 TaxID=2824762 RepID=UPI001C2F76A8|nr:glycosyltransferase [Cohnella sp. GbtcB17]